MNDLQINICAYSGHGISHERAEELNTLELAKEIFEQQQAAFLDEVNQLGYCCRSTCGGKLDSFRFNVGDMVLKQNVPTFIGIRDISAYWLEAMKDHPNKFLVVVLDSCHARGAAEVLPDILESAVNYYTQAALEVDASSAIVVQFACGSNESAYAGYFTPTFVRLQHCDTLLAVANLYEAVKTNPSLMHEGFLPNEETDPPAQHVSFSVFNTSNGDPLAENNASLHRNLYFEAPNWPLVLIKDPLFFEFCHRVFQHDADVLDADADAVARGDLGFRSDQFTRFEELLAAAGSPDVTIFNHWLKMWWDEEAGARMKMAIVPFFFSMEDGREVRASAHYHFDTMGHVACVNYYECKQRKNAGPGSSQWFDKRASKVHRYREQIHGPLPDCHERFYQKCQHYIGSPWNQRKWRMSKAKDPLTYSYEGLSTTQKRGQFEEEALDKLVKTAKAKRNEDSDVPSTPSLSTL